MEEAAAAGAASGDRADDEQDAPEGDDAETTDGAASGGHEDDTTTTNGGDHTDGGVDPTAPKQKKERRDRTPQVLANVTDHFTVRTHMMTCPIDANILLYNLHSNIKWGAK